MRAIVYFCDNCGKMLSTCIWSKEFVVKNSRFGEPKELHFCSRKCKREFMRAKEAGKE